MFLTGKNSFSFMKGGLRYFSFLGVLCFGFLFMAKEGRSQFADQSRNINGKEKEYLSNWSKNKDLYGQKAFVKNVGQYDLEGLKEDSVLYGADVGDIVLFTRDGVIFKIEPDKGKSLSVIEEKMEEGEELEEVDHYFFRMEWKGADPDRKVKVKGASDHTYTFGDAVGKRTRGYDELIYKNLYPGIDVIYEFPRNNGGLKYRVVARPGADIEDLRMSYRVEKDSIHLDPNGNLRVGTPYGDVIDHAPSNSFVGNKKVEAEFELEKRTVGFKVKDRPSEGKELVIDPWTTTPSNLNTPYGNLVFDVAYDDKGNVYVAGGDGPFKFAKYSPMGNLLWTYTWPSSWASSTGTYYYSEFSVLPHSGSIYVGQGFTVNSGAKVMKIGSDGSFVDSSSQFNGTKEIWTMVYNRCTGQLIGFGGGTSGKNNSLQLISDTNLTSSTAINHNNSNATCCNDIADALMDANGDFYAIMSTVDPYNPSHDEHIQKGLAPGYTTMGFSVESGYSLEEGFPASQIPIIDDVTIDNAGTVRENILALNESFLYSYDGKSLKAWDKTNGNMLDSVEVSSSYTGGTANNHEGIAVDKCNNIYLAGDSKVHLYHFDGNTLSPTGQLTSGVPGRVYDIRLNPWPRQLIVGGNDFLTVLDPVSCTDTSEIHLSMEPQTCDSLGSITVDSIAGYSPPYEYQWNTGDTTATIDSLPAGNYTVTVIKTSCGQPLFVDSTVTMNSVGSLVVDSIDMVQPSCTDSCGGSLDISYSGAASNLEFSIDSGNTFQTDSLFTNLCPGTYDLVLQDDSCSYYQIVTLEMGPGFEVDVTSSTSTCSGNCSGEIDISTTGGDSPFQFSVDGGNTFQPDSVFTSLCDSIYPVIVEDSNGCQYDTSIAISTPLALSLNVDSVFHASCGGDTGRAYISAIGGYSPYSFQWGPGTGNQTGPSATNLSGGTYQCVVTDTAGCMDSISVTILGNPPPTVDLPPDTTICYGEDLNLVATVNSGTSPFDYYWNNGLGNASTHLISPVSDEVYTVWVEDSLGCQTQEDTIEVEVLPELTLTTTPGQEICYGEQVTIGSTVNGGDGNYNYSWSNGATSDSIIVSPSPPDSTYTLTVTSGCPNSSASSSTSITVHPDPVANFTGERLNDCIPMEVVFENKTDSTLMGSCAWSFGDSDSSYSCYDVQHSYDEYGTYDVTLLVTSPEGCTDSNSIQVSSGDCKPVLELPNVFTPNGDNDNDLLEPVRIENIDNLQMTIYNRWGQMVHRTNNKNIEWDGEKDGGRPVPEGTYYWVVEFSGKDENKIRTRSGDLTLIR